MALASRTAQYPFIRARKALFSNLQMEPVPKRGNGQQPG
jgi:hypothetical protein